MRVCKLRLLVVLAALGMLLLMPVSARAEGYVYADQWPVLGEYLVSGVHHDGHGGLFVTLANGSDPCGVRKYASDGTLLFGFGTYGNGPGQFELPFDVVTAANGDIYVSDAQTNYVSVFDESGRYLRRFGGFGWADGQFSQATGLAFDSNGVLYVGDANTGRVQAFEPAGTWLRTIGDAGTGDGQFNGVWGLDVDSQDRLYVTDGYGARIEVFDSYANGNGYLAQWPADGVGLGGTVEATSVAVGPDDRVFVGMSYGDGPYASTIQEFAFDGTNATYVRTVDSGSGTGDGQFGSRVFGIDANARGDLFAADAWAMRVQKLAWDDTAPVLRHDYDGEWHSQPFVVTFWGDDDYTPMPWLRWSLDAVDWTNSGHITVPVDAATHAYDGFFKPIIGAGDSVSNWHYMNLRIKVDTRAPRSTVSGMPTRWTNQYVFADIAASDYGSGVDHSYYDLDGAGLTEVPANGVVRIDTAGVHTLQYWSQDNCADVPNREAPKSVQVRIDLNGPSARPTNAPIVRRYATTTFKYLLMDDLSPTCTVKLVIKKKTKVVKTVSLGTKDSSLQAVAHAYSKRLAVNLPAGVYTWTVVATDLAGNKGTWAPKRLTVR